MQTEGAVFRSSGGESGGFPTGQSGSGVSLNSEGSRRGGLYLLGPMKARLAHASSAVGAAFPAWTKQKASLSFSLVLPDSLFEISGIPEERLQEPPNPVTVPLSFLLP